jgi:hypothetical protein
MTVDEVFATFVQKEGTTMLKDHVVQVWWYAQLDNEATLLEVISNLSSQYEDPLAAEIGFISLWSHIARG